MARGDGDQCGQRRAGGEVRGSGPACGVGVPRAETPASGPAARDGRWRDHPELSGGNGQPAGKAAPGPGRRRNLGRGRGRRGAARAGGGQPRGGGANPPAAPPPRPGLRPLPQAARDLLGADRLIKCRLFPRGPRPRQPPPGPAPAGGASIIPEPVAAPASSGGGAAPDTALAAAGRGAGPAEAASAMGDPRCPGERVCLTSPASGSRSERSARRSGRTRFRPARAWGEPCDLPAPQGQKRGLRPPPALAPYPRGRTQNQT